MISPLPSRALRLLGYSLANRAAIGINIESHYMHAAAVPLAGQFNAGNNPQSSLHTPANI